MIDSVKLLIPYQTFETYISSLELGNLSFANLKVKTTNDGVTIENSLSKFYFGTNFHQFQTFDELQKALEKLATALKIPFDDLLKSELHRIDINCNFGLSVEIPTFNKFIGNCGKQSKSNYLEQTATFGLKTNKEFQFYDKKKEMGHQLRSAQQRKNLSEIELISTLLHEFKDYNILRIEQRYLNQRAISETFDNGLALQNLLEKATWQTIKEKYIAKFKQISIWEIPTNEPSSKNILDYIFSEGYKLLGVEVIEAMIKREPDAKQRYEIKQAIKKKLKNIETLDYKQIILEKINSQFDQFINSVEA